MTLKSKFTDAQKRDAVREMDEGTSAAVVAKRMGVSSGALYYWRKEMSGKPRRTSTPPPSGYRARAHA